MFRYSIIIVIFIVLLIYLLRLVFSEHVQGRLRVASLVLLGIFLFVLGAAVYSNYRNYSVQTIKEEFQSNREQIIKDINSYYQNKEYTKARELAQKFLKVQDPELREWFVRSREAELNQRLANLKKDAHQKRLEILKELARVTGKEVYKQSIEAENRRYKVAIEERIKERIDQFATRDLAQKALGYKLLLEVYPEKTIYRQKYEDLRQKIKSLIEDSPWNSVCPSNSVPYCQHIGFVAYASKEVKRSESKSPLGQIFGVSWRPKGTLISRDGRVAPEDGYYYLINAQDQMVLYHVDYVAKENPFSGRLDHFLDSRVRDDGLRSH